MKRRLDLFIFADALGWKLAEQQAVLTDLLPRRMPCETLLGYSATCDPTILTGAWPRDHRHFSFFVKATGDSPFRALRWLASLPHRLAAHHRVRHRLSRWLAARQGYTGYFQLYSVPFWALPFLDYTEKRDIYEPGGINGGQPTIFECWQQSGRPWMRSDWRKGDDRNFEEANAAVDGGEVELMYLFTAGLDATMHRHGPEHPKVTEAFTRFGHRVEALYERAQKRYADVFIYLFSDHGMTRVTRQSDLRPRFEKLGLQFGRDYHAVWDSTMARFWFNDVPARRDALTYLQAQPEGRLLAEAELQAWGCDFPDQQFGEHFFLLEPGALFVPSFLNLGFVAGMHGYAPEHPDSRACWLTNHPTATARRLVDIYPVMRAAAESK